MQDKKQNILTKHFFRIRRNKKYNFLKKHIDK